MRHNTVKELNETIRHGNEEINFKILLTKRKTISIMVYTDRSVKVRAPYRTSVKYIKKSVEQRADWIKSKQDLFVNYTPVIRPKRAFECGEIYNFLGKQYHLKVSHDLVNRVHIENDILHVSVTQKDKNKIKKLIDNWYKDTAKNIFLERLDICKAAVFACNIEYNSELRFRKMKSMWGNCTRSGRITLSYELVKAPMECIDYVIIHELCHLKEFNHSKAFYRLLDKAMPGWKAHKNTLKGIKDLYSE